METSAQQHSVSAKRASLSGDLRLKTLALVGHFAFSALKQYGLCGDVARLTTLPVSFHQLYEDLP